MKVHSGQITGHSQARGAIYRKPIITLQSFCSQQYRTTGVPFDKHSRDRSTNLKPYISQIVQSDLALQPNCYGHHMAKQNITAKKNLARNFVDVNQM
jgi:hypothetical protein